MIRNSSAGWVVALAICSALSGCWAHVSEPCKSKRADHEGIKREYRPAAGFTGPSYTAWVQDRELWVTWFRRTSDDEGEWEQSELSLAFKPLALTGSGPGTVFLAGEAVGRRATVRQRDFEVREGRLEFSERELLDRPDLGRITDMSYVEELGVLILLEASACKLWALDVETRDLSLVTTASEVPALCGRRSINTHLEPRDPVGLSYVLTANLQGDDAIDLGDEGTLVILDRAPRRPGVDGYEIHR